MRQTWRCAMSGALKASIGIKNDNTEIIEMMAILGAAIVLKTSMTVPAFVVSEKIPFALTATLLLPTMIKFAFFCFASMDQPLLVHAVCYLLSLWWEDTLIAIFCITRRSFCLVSSSRLVLLAVVVVLLLLVL